MIRRIFILLKRSIYEKDRQEDDHGHETIWRETFSI